jgi:cellulose synthase/poly-beta-1,6-N-acetylglucosamine synthase-like glycosyltransferase
VLQLDIERLPTTLAVADSYHRAFVVARRRGFPVAQFYLPLHGGRVDMEHCRRELQVTLRQREAAWAVDNYLGPEQPAAPVVSGTVAICTRERPDDLTRALTAVCALDPAPDEILVVDNNPVTSRTQAVVAGFPGVRYARENRPGLDAARNHALKEAASAVVAFTDDDAAPEPAWLGHLLQPFRDPRVLCTTGLTLPLELETTAQEWFEQYSPFGRGFDRKMLDGIHHDPLAVAEIGAGANMAVRRTIVDRVGAFDEALDAGTATHSGGDHEMFGRILAAGYRIVYEPRAVSWHRHRRTWEELREALRGYGTGVYAIWTRRLVDEHELGVLRHASRWLYRAQLPRLWEALRRRPDSVPIDLLFAELRGCLAGPGAYRKARRQARAAGAR